MGADTVPTSGSDGGLLMIKEVGYTDNSPSASQGLAGPREFLLPSMYYNYKGLILQALMLSGPGLFNDSPANVPFDLPSVQAPVTGAITIYSTPLKVLSSWRLSEEEHTDILFL